MYRFKLPAFVLLLPLLAGCVFIVPMGPGRVSHFNAEVRFKNADGSPAAGKPFYIIETFQKAQIITEMSTTGADGIARVKGPRCPPITVATNGGTATLQPTDRSAGIAVPLSGDGLPDLVATYGQYDPKRRFQRIAPRADCVA